jgi:hypothetical protein
MTVNGEANCILAVCCDSESPRRVEMLAAEMVHYGVDASSAKKCAAYMLKAYDLAPPGSLQAFKDAIRDLAREGYRKV